MTKHLLEVVVNLLFWLLTAWLITSSFSIESHEILLENGVETVHITRNNELIKKLLICVVLSAVLFYVNLFVVLRLNKGATTGTVIWQSLGLFLLTLGLYRFAEYLSMGSRQLYLPAQITWGVITFYYTISVAYGMGKVWQRTESQRQQLSFEKTEAELTLLRAQLHPHFLFNALNNLLAMVDQQKNPVLASSLDRLSGLLRYVVYDTASAKVPVQKEIDFIKNFAALQSLRFEDAELEVDLSITGDYDKQMIEPGIFIPFVENAFKYGTEPESKSTINISFDFSDPAKIKFSIVNPVYPTMQLQKGNGSGIPTAKNRLQLVYPGRHHLKIREDENYSLELEIITDESDYH